MNSLLSTREFDGERRAFAFDAVNLNRRVMEIDDMLDNGKTETGPAGVSAPCLIDPVEPFKDTAHFFRRDADAVIFDDQIRAVRSLLDGDLDLAAFRRVVDRIGDEIQDDLFDAVHVRL